MRSITTFSRVFLAVFLRATCVGKLWSGYRAYYSIPQQVFVLAIIVEMILMLGLLVDKCSHLASIGVGLMAAIGTAIEMFGRGATCGCMGSMVRLTSGQHILVDATIGALAVVVWHGKSVELARQPG